MNTFHSQGDLTEDLHQKKEETSTHKADHASQPFNRGPKRSSSRLDFLIPTDIKSTIKKNVESY